MYPPIYQETTQFEGNYYTIPTGGPISSAGGSSTDHTDSSEMEKVNAVVDGHHPVLFLSVLYLSVRSSVDTV